MDYKVWPIEVADLERFDSKFSRLICLKIEAYNGNHALVSY